MSVETGTLSRGCAALWRSAGSLAAAACCILIGTSCGPVHSTAPLAAGADAGRQQQSTAQIVVRTQEPVREIRPELFGANICWPMHTNNLDPAHDTAEDFIALAPLAKEVGLTMLRYPGGLWSDAYRWKRAIGPQDHRQGGSVNGTGDEQLSIIGTDEYLRFCEAAGMQGIVTVNYGLCTAASPGIAYQEAADWVEYCNAPNDGSNPGGGTDWAGVRARNGHPEPYGVRYWEIGNEIYHAGNPQWGHTDVMTYATRCVEFARAMKAVAPAIKVGAVAHMKTDFVSPNDTKIGSDRPWNRTILDIAGREIDFLIPHVYSGGIGGRQAFLTSNGAVGGTYTADSPAEYTITAEVGGDLFREAWSRFQLEVDGAVVAEADVSSKHPKPFSQTVRLGAGKHVIGVRFINDIWVKGEGDRNLSIGGLFVTDPTGKRSRLSLISPQDRVSLCTAVVESDREKLRALRALIREVLPDRAESFELAVTEWNENPRTAGTLSSALHAAAKLMMMAEEGIESAHYWLLFNAVAYRRTELWFPADGLRLPRPSAFVFQIFDRHCGKQIVTCDVSAPPLPPLDKERKGHAALGSTLDVLATLDGNGSTLGIIVINRNVTEAIETHISWPGFAADDTATLTVLTGTDPYENNAGCTRSADLRAEAVTDKIRVDRQGVTCTFAPMSVTGFSLKAR